MKIRDNKKIIIMILFVSVICSMCGYYYTYARYQSEGNVSGNTDVAEWSVKVNGVDITPNAIATFTAGLVGETSQYVKNGFIAPGMTGISNIKINPTGSEVAMNYYIMIDHDTINNSNFIIDSVSIGGSCSDGVSNETECEDLGLTWTPNNLSLTSPGSCANPDYLTETTCTNAFEIWTPNPYANAYAGVINLPVGGVMTSNEIINAKVKLLWQDLNTSTANANDILTAEEATGDSKTININVVVEQKIN